MSHKVEKSRPLSLRLNRKTLAQIVLLMHNKGLRTTEYSLPSLVKILLEKTVNTFAEQGLVDYDPSQTEIDQILSPWKSERIKTSDPIIDVDSFFSNLEETANKIKEEEELEGTRKYPQSVEAAVEVNNKSSLIKALERDDEDPVAAVIENLRKQSEPVIEGEAVIFEGEIEDDKGPSEMFWKTKGIHWDVIAKSQPANTLITSVIAESKEKADDDPQVSIYKHCIELVFDQIPEKEWNTPRAIQLVESLYEDNQ